MNISKKCAKIIRYQLAGAQKKAGVNTWRYVFNAVENGTGLERKFFIELSMLNPYLSPSDVVLGFKPRVKISEDDLQNVLAGTLSAQKLQSESILTPSYVVVRAGVLGVGAKQICNYFPVKQIKIDPKNFSVEAGNCVFTEEKLSGRMDFSPSELHDHPEQLCESGIVSWELRYEIKDFFDEGYEGKNSSWYATGIKTVFAGNITLDGKEYSIQPRKSCGYMDRFFGKSYPENYIHLSSSNLTSQITGKFLSDSSFSVTGLYDGRVNVMVNLEGLKVSFCASKPKSAYQCVSDFSQMPEVDGSEKLHWTISTNDKNYVVDVDVFCLAKLMYVRSLELPEGERKVLKQLMGGNGTGEIRLYKRIKKNLELIEHAEIQTCLCEFGQLELPEN